jgi:AcrR family transcriptional regulator
MDAAQRATVRRPYRSTLRAAQARATLAAVLDAAARLFEARGFAATTVQGIAEASGVAVETVYAQGSKASLLLACVDRALAGDVEVPLIERPEIAAALIASDQHVITETFARTLVAMSRRASGLIVAFEQGAAADPKLAELWEEYERRRRQDYRRLVEALAAAGALRDGWDIEAATDALWATLSPHTAHALSQRLAWPSDRLVDWSVGIVGTLLVPASSRRRRAR